MSESTTTTRRRKPRKKQRKPYGARALLAALTLGGTMMGWVALAQQVDKSAAVDPGFAGEPLLVSAAPQQAAPTQPAATSIELAPIPTVVPPPGGDVAQLTLDPIPETVVLQPIPAVSRPVISRPVVRSRSSR